MYDYVALLRGINVGGKNMISMSELKKCFEENGFKNVETYLNSGNILFSSELTDIFLLKNVCELLIKNSFNLSILVAIVSADDLLNAMSNAPDWWNKDSDSKHNVIFIIPPTTTDEIFINVGVAKPEYEKIGFYGNVIFWSAAIKTFSRTRWSKIVSTSVYNSITIRNSNTALKLKELFIKRMEK